CMAPKCPAMPRAASPATGKRRKSNRGQAQIKSPACARRSGTLAGMRTNLGAVMLAVALGACATVADVDRARESWQGATYEEVLRAWGAPVGSTRTADGRDWYTWVTASAVQPGPSVGFGLGGMSVGRGSATGVGVGVGVPVGSPPTPTQLLDADGDQLRLVGATLVIESDDHQAERRCTSGFGRVHLDHDARVACTGRDVDESTVADGARPGIECRHAGNDLLTAVEQIEAHHRIAQPRVSRAETGVARAAKTRRQHREKYGRAVGRSDREKVDADAPAYQVDDESAHAAVDRASGAIAEVEAHDLVVGLAVAVHVDVDDELVRRRTRPGVVVVDRKDQHLCARVEGECLHTHGAHIIGLVQLILAFWC